MLLLFLTYLAALWSSICCSFSLWGSIFYPKTSFCNAQKMEPEQSCSSSLFWQRLLEIHTNFIPLAEVNHEVLVQLLRAWAAALAWWLDVSGSKSHRLVVRVKQIAGHAVEPVRGLPRGHPPTFWSQRNLLSGQSIISTVFVPLNFFHETAIAN